VLTRRKPQAERRGAAPQPLPLRRIPWRWIGGAMAGVVLVVAGAAGVRWLLDPHTLPIQRVQISGQFRHLNSAQLQEAVAGTVVGGFFTVDVEAVMRAARTLPWVDTASVRRVWPDTLRLEVVEQVPLARWGEHDLLNPRGERFTPPADTLPDGLPQLQGPEGLEATITASYFEMGKALAADGLKITRLIQDPRRSWHVGLDNGIELRLGNDSAYTRLLRFVRLYPKVLAMRATDIATVDLRYTNGFAVAWNHPPDKAKPPQQGEHS
jgi:cell division protein FtsQ